MTKSPVDMSITGLDQFGSTRWSVVLAAGGEGVLADEALASLCEVYWLPIFGYVRRRTPQSADAYDLTQAFFVDILERKLFAVAAPERGKFRSFILTSLKNFLSNEHTRKTAQKRGGNISIRSLNREVVEQYYQRSATIGRTPDEEFERHWALALLEHVLNRLRDEQITNGRSHEFTLLQAFLTGDANSLSQADVAAQLNTTAEAVRAAVYRLRKRYRVILRDEVAQVVSSTDEVDDELQRLFLAISK